MVSSVLPLRNFSANHELKQASYCFFNSLQFSPMLFIVFYKVSAGFFYRQMMKSMKILLQSLCVLYPSLF